MMLIKRILLENIYSHRKSEIRFGRGLTAIIGPNGAGKSSIVEAILLALFDRGAQSSQEILRTGKSKKGVVRIGSQLAIIELEFEVGGRIYRVRREYDGDGNSRDHYLEDMSDGSRRVLARGVSNVTNYIASKILGAEDPSIFTSTIFSRQDMLAQILEISPRDRWEKILRMMGLEELERAREVAKDAADRADKMLGEIARDEGELKDLRSKLERDMRDAARLREELSAIDSRLSSEERRREDLEASAKVLRSVIEKIRELETLKHLSNELDRLENELRDIKTRLSIYAELGLDRESVLRLYETYKKSNQCSERKTNIENRIKSYEEEIAKLKKSSEELRSIAKSLGIDMGDISQETLETVKKASEELSRRLGEIKGAIATYTKLLELKPEGGRCPFCGKELGLDEAKHIVKRHMEEIGMLKKEEDLLEKRIKEINNLYKKLGEILAGIRSYSSRVEELLKELENVAACAEERESICSWVNTVTSKIFQGRSGSCADILSKMTEEIRILEERHRRAEERLKELEELGIRDRISYLEKELENLFTSNQWLRRLENYEEELKKIEEDSKKVQQIIEDLKNRRGSLEGELSRLEKIIREREERILFLEKRISMKPSLEKSLKILRILEKNFFGKEGLLSRILTQIVVKRLEEEVNKALETFSTQFRVSIEEDFNISVRTQESSILGLNNLSGGERTILAIAFRIALAKTLLGRLPGLMILDEPTQNLDVKNKARLFEIVRDIAGILEQVIVVTHDEEIIEKADNIIRIRNVDGESRVEIT
jgi:exonuclease SbcC